MEKYLFITVPNNSGSKLIVQLLAGCKNIIALPREGERFVNIPAAKSRFWTQTDQLEPMNNSKNYDFKHIKETWNKLWKQSSHYSKASPKIFMEKSPPNVLRAQMYEKEFLNSYFIIMVRNPYATVEGILRRCSKRRPIDVATNHWIDTTKKQIENINILKNNIYFTYEDLCDKPGKVKKLIVSFLPELNDFKPNSEVSMPAKVIKSVGSVKMRPTNLNAKQIANLSKTDIKEINKYLTEHTDLLDYFGYKIIGAE